jgi:hypothetical protein
MWAILYADPYFKRLVQWGIRCYGSRDDAHANMMLSCFNKERFLICHVDDLPKYGFPHPRPVRHASEVFGVGEISPESPTATITIVPTKEDPCSDPPR